MQQRLYSRYRGIHDLRNLFVTLTLYFVQHKCLPLLPGKFLYIVVQDFSTFLIFELRARIRCVVRDGNGFFSVDAFNGIKKESPFFAVFVPDKLQGLGGGDSINPG